MRSLLPERCRNTPKKSKLDRRWNNVFPEVTKKCPSSLNAWIYSTSHRMLVSSRTNRLCSKCSSDLLKVFERAFYTTQTTRPAWSQALSAAPRRRRLPTISQCSPRRLQSQQTAGHAENLPVDGRQKDIDDDLTEQESNAIQRLEEALGKSVEDAIEEDQAAAFEHVDGDLDEDIQANEGLGEGTIEVEAGEDPIAALRGSGAGIEQVAREARQVFGESLPDGVLEEHEVKVYTRLYGEPKEYFDDEFLKEAMEEEDFDDDEPQLLNTEGEPLDHLDIESEAPSRPEEQDDAVDADSVPPEELELSDSMASRIRSVAEALGAETFHQELSDQDTEDSEDPHERSHPLTKLGRFGTSPSTINLPQDKYTQPFQDVMSDFSNKHLKEVCERVFGGGGLPDSPLTPRSGKLRPQVPVALEASQFAMTEMEANAFMTAIFPPAYAAITSVLVETRKRLGPTWLNELLAKEGGPRVLDAGAGGAGILAWNEVVKAHWEAMHTSEIPPPPSCKSVVLTGSDPLRHRAAGLLENTTFIPRLPDYSRTREIPTLSDDRPAQQRKQFDIVIAPYTLLPVKEDWEKKVYVQNLWSLLSSSGGILILIEKGIPRGFEAIAGARELLLEKHIASPLSHPTHYSSTPELEQDSVHEKKTGMIVAPCTNHTQCPLYRIPGKSQGRKDICSFQQRYIRPPHLQRALGAKDRNHDDVDFSYISVMKGRDLRQHEITTFQQMIDPLSAPVPPNADHQSPHPAPTNQWLETCQQGFFTATPTSTSSTQPSTSSSPSSVPLHALPRLILPPLKRQGHILLDLCTPLGTLERWTVPRSYSRLAFRDARKSQWGDLWGLGAKTRVSRTTKVGVGSKEVREMMKKMPGGGGGRGVGVGVGGAGGNGSGGVNGVGKARNREERLKNQAVKLMQRMEEQKAEEREEQREMEMQMAQDFDVPLSEVRSAVRDSTPTSGPTQRDRVGGIDGILSSPRRSRDGQARLDEVGGAFGSYDDGSTASALADWEAEYASDMPNQRKKGGAFRTQGITKASKAAKKEQKFRWAMAQRGKSMKEDGDE